LKLRELIEMECDRMSDSAPRSNSAGWRKGVLFFILFILFIIIIQFLAFKLIVNDLEILFYEKVGFQKETSSILSLIVYCAYSITFIAFISWLIFFRSNFKALLGMFVMFGTGPLILAVLGSESCFNQATGEPVKWYVLRPDGDVTLFSSGGFDPVLGVEKHPVTPTVCRIIERQKKGLKPREITAEIKNNEFFDSVTGRPRVWYHRDRDGEFKLFNAEGFFNGQLLLPVTDEIVSEFRTRVQAETVAARARAVAEAAEAARGAKATREREELALKERTRTELVGLFGTATYPANVVIVGTKSRGRDNTASLEAAQRLQESLADALRRRGMVVDEFRPAIYSTVHFDALMNGEFGILAEAGLAQKMRAGVLSTVESTCQAATSLAGAFTCTVAAETRVIAPRLGRTDLRRWSQTGAGATTKEAILRAVEILVARYPELVDSI